MHNILDPVENALHTVITFLHSFHRLHGIKASSDLVGRLGGAMVLDQDSIKDMPADVQEWLREIYALYESEGGMPPDDTIGVKKPGENFY